MTTDAQLRQLAASIGPGLGELEFGAVFDEMVAANGGSVMEHFKIVRAMCIAPETPFEAALTLARDRGWLDALVERLLAAGAFDAQAPEDPVRVVLQGITQQRLGFLDAATLNSGVMTAIRRVCRIAIGSQDGAIFGTGFLIGPQAVLTAGHVVDSLIGPNGSEKQGSEQNVVITFDHVGGAARTVECGLARNWLIGFSRAHALEQPGVAALDFDTCDPTDFDTHLDFAIIRLNRAVGNLRGFYALDEDHLPRVAANENTSVLVFQHPGGRRMYTATGAALRLWPDSMRTRLHHDANTMAGSSGGLVLDADLKPVAVHQSGIQSPDGQTFANGAIPTACIGAGKLDCLSVVGFDPLLKTASGQAVIGRADFQEQVSRAIAGQGSIFVVRGERRSGLSFSTEILKTMAGSTEHLFLVIRASEIPTDARDLAIKLLRLVDETYPETGLPKPGDGDTAREAWIRDSLFPKLAEALDAARGSRTLWLIIDDLHKDFIPETSCRRLLERLYHEILSLPFLRIVLLGLSGAVPGAPAGAVWTDSTGPFNQGEIEDYLNRSLVRAGKNATESAVRMMAGSVVDDAGSSPGDKVPNMAELATRRAERMIREATS